MRDVTELYRIFSGAYARGVRGAIRLHVDLVNARTADEWNRILVDRAAEIRTWAEAG